MAKKLHDAKAKAKRQKIMAAGGGVLLLAVLAVQVPRTMKMMNAEAPPPPPAAAAPTSADPSVLPTPSSATGAAPAPSGAISTVNQSDLPPTPAAGQLISFGRFSSKDPFAEQIDPDAAAPVVESSAPAAVRSAEGTKSADEPRTAEEGSVVGTGSQPSDQPTAAPASAVISVNGAEETVAIKAEFPKDAPVFRLVSLSGGQAKIGIAGGKLASGAPTVTLRLGKAVTLVNTADGTRYELKLVAVA